MTAWIDISQPLNAAVPTWPGDTPFSYEVAWPMETSGSVNVGKITMSIHTGTHIDAPFHFDNEGKRVMDLDINLYIGPARVIHLDKPTCIGPEAFAEIDLHGVTRLLVHTGAWTDRSVFPNEIPPVDPSLAAFLSERGVRLLGLDLPSVDPLDSKELPAHHALSSHGVHILEGAVLAHVSPGNYELAALPLPITDGDGSPVRAVLRLLK